MCQAQLAVASLSFRRPPLHTFVVDASLHCIDSLIPHCTECASNYSLLITISLFLFILYFLLSPTFLSAFHYYYFALFTVASEAVLYHYYDGGGCRCDHAFLMMMMMVRCGCVWRSRATDALQSIFSSREAAKLKRIRETRVRF